MGAANLNMVTPNRVVCIYDHLINISFTVVFFTGAAHHILAELRSKEAT